MNSIGFAIYSLLGVYSEKYPANKPVSRKTKPAVDRIPFFMHNADVLSKKENIQSMHQKYINRFHVHFLNRFSGL
jgi:hypothetical protein